MAPALDRSAIFEFALGFTTIAAALTVAVLAWRYGRSVQRGQRRTRVQARPPRPLQPGPTTLVLLLALVLAAAAAFAGPLTHTASASADSVSARLRRGRSEPEGIAAPQRRSLRRLEPGSKPGPPPKRP